MHLISAIGRIPFHHDRHFVFHFPSVVHIMHEHDYYRRSIDYIVNGYAVNYKRNTTGYETRKHEKARDLCTNECSVQCMLCMHLWILFLIFTACAVMWTWNSAFNAGPPNTLVHLGSTSRRWLSVKKPSHTVWVTRNDIPSSEYVQHLSVSFTIREQYSLWISLWAYRRNSLSLRVLLIFSSVVFFLFFVRCIETC